MASLDNAARAIIIGFYFEVTRRIAEKIHINTVSVKLVEGIEAISENYDALLVDAWGYYTMVCPATQA